MIGLTLKTLMALTLSYILFSFQIGGKYVFNHIIEFTGPLGENIQESLGVAANNTWDKSKEVGSQLFTNSKPKVESFISSSKKNIKKVISTRPKKIDMADEELLEDLKKEEMSHLDRIIESE